MFTSPERLKAGSFVVTRTISKEQLAGQTLDNDVRFRCPGYIRA